MKCVDNMKTTLPGHRCDSSIQFGCPILVATKSRPIHQRGIWLFHNGQLDRSCRQHLRHFHPNRPKCSKHSTGKSVDCTWEWRAFVQQPWWTWCDCGYARTFAFVSAPMMSKIECHTSIQLMTTPSMRTNGTICFVRECEWNSRSSNAYHRQ